VFGTQVLYELTVRLTGKEITYVRPYLKEFNRLEVVFAFLFTIELFVRCLVQYSFASPKKYFQEVLSDVFFYIDVLAVLPTYIDIAIGWAVQVDNISTRVESAYAFSA
jgi:hypothetical protein